MNGDGVNDLLVAAYLTDGSVADVGSIYVVHGPIAGDVDLWTDADATLSGTVKDERAGNAVALGDFDLDGVDSIVGGTGIFHSTTGYSGRVFFFQGPLSGAVLASSADAQRGGRRVPRRDQGRRRRGRRRPRGPPDRHALPAARRDGLRHRRRLPRRQRPAEGHAGRVLPGSAL